MKQQTFSDFECASRRRQTKRENFLNLMNAMIPWSQWAETIQPHYPKGERAVNHDKLMRLLSERIKGGKGFQQSLKDTY